jgi:hypothetical protein
MSLPKVWRWGLLFVLAGCGRTSHSGEDGAGGALGSGGSNAQPGEPELLYDFGPNSRPRAISYYEGQLYFGLLTTTSYDFYQASADGSGTPEKLGSITTADAALEWQVLAADAEHVYWTAGNKLVRFVRDTKLSEEFATPLVENMPGARVELLPLGKLLVAQTNCSWISVFDRADMSRVDVQIADPGSSNAGGRLVTLGNKFYCPNFYNIFEFEASNPGPSQVAATEPAGNNEYHFNDLTTMKDELYAVRSALRKNAIIERVVDKQMVHVATIDGAYQSTMVADEKRGTFYVGSVNIEHPIYKVDAQSGAVSELIGTAQPAKMLVADEDYIYWTTDNYVVPKPYFTNGIYRQSKDAPTR